jgi:hypothetical protein
MSWGAGRTQGSPSIIGFFNGAFQPHLDQMQFFDEKKNNRSNHQ